MDTIVKLIFERAVSIADGHSELGMGDLSLFAGRLQVDKFKDEFLPGPKTISGKASERKAEILRQTETLWGLSPQQWLEKEAAWLQSARIISESQETGGKDDLDDLISPELLIRMLATIRFVDSLPNPNSILADEALVALNLVISEAVAKGRTRMVREGGKTHYSVLKGAGIMIGTGGGKYLPNPGFSLPYLFFMLDRKLISPQAYK